MKDEEKLQDISTQVKPITCPQCGSTELAFVTHYKKEIILKIICLLCTFVALYAFAMHILPAIITDHSPQFISIFIIFAILAIVFWIGALIRESETHVQAICKNCGHIWLLN